MAELWSPRLVAVPHEHWSTGFFCSTCQEYEVSFTVPCAGISGRGCEPVDRIRPATVMGAVPGIFAVWRRWVRRVGLVARRTYCEALVVNSQPSRGD